MNKDVCYAKRRSAGGESCTQGVGVFVKRKRVQLSSVSAHIEFCVLARTPFQRVFVKIIYLFMYVLGKKKKESRKKHVHKGATLRKPCPSLSVSYAVVFKWNKCAFTFCHTHRTIQWDTPKFCPTSVTDYSLNEYGLL